MNVKGSRFWQGGLSILPAFIVSSVNAFLSLTLHLITSSSFYPSPSSQRTFKSLSSLVTGGMLCCHIKRHIPSTRALFLSQTLPMIITTQWIHRRSILMFLVIPSCTATFRLRTLSLFGTVKEFIPEYTIKPLSHQTTVFSRQKMGAYKYLYFWDVRSIGGIRVSTITTIITIIIATSTVYRFFCIL